MRSLNSDQNQDCGPQEKQQSSVGLHRDCFACGLVKGNLGLGFRQTSVDSVTAQWFCDKRYQSFPGIVHGGVIATLLDAAMTNCLLMKGIPAVTADMHVRYRKSLEIGMDVMVHGVLIRSRPPLYILEAKIVQNGLVCANAHARFMRSDAYSNNNYV